MPGISSLRAAISSPQAAICVHFISAGQRLSIGRGVVERVDRECRSIARGGKKTARTATCAQDVDHDARS